MAPDRTRSGTAPGSPMASREIRDVLARATEEAARLLAADGAIVYLVDPADGMLHFAQPSGIDDRAVLERIRSITLTPGTGMFGGSVATRSVMVTHDYLADRSFTHAEAPDDVVRALGIRSMVVAPLVSGDAVFGALGTFSTRVHAFDDAQIGLVRALADHAAATIARVRLIEELDRSRDELRASEARYRRLVQTTPDVIYQCDAEGRFTFMAEGVEALFGWTPEEILGKSFAELTGETSLEEALTNFEAQKSEHDVVRRFRYHVKHRDGSVFPAEITSLSVWEGGRFAGVQGPVRGIAEQERLARSLWASEERYRFLVEHSPDIVFATDAEGRFTFMSEGLERIAGWAATDVLGENFAKIVEPTSHSTAWTRWNLLVQEPTTEQTARVALRGVDGRLIPVEVSAIGILDGRGRFAGIHGSARDISERVRLERDLRLQASELAASEERAHLARELHDSVTQALFSMTLVSRSVELLIDRDPGAARERLEQLRELQREALAEMRALIAELRPGELERDGLVAALRAHANAVQGRVGLPIVVAADLPERLPAIVEEALYRIAQEALHNVVKHAVANEARVELDWDGGGVRLLVTDDGVGFDPTTVPHHHLGLTGMAARAQRIGARFACRSERNRGTAIEVLLDGAALHAAAVAARAEAVEAAVARTGGQPAAAGAPGTDGLAVETLDTEPVPVEGTGEPRGASR